MKNLFCVLLFFLVLALSGCEAVFTQQPMGDEAVDLDPATWQGTWLSDQVVMLTTVLDRENGQLEAAWVERGSDGAKFERVMGSVRRSGEVTYLNMEHMPEAIEGAAADSARDMQAGGQVTPEFFWARIENDGRRAVLWWPDVEQVRAAVDDGRLPGVIKQDNDVVLGRLEASHVELINAPASSLLQWQQPVTFIRIGD
jgi:hypothetical protein